MMLSLYIQKSIWRCHRYIYGDAPGLVLGTSGCGNRVRAAAMRHVSTISSLWQHNHTIKQQQNSFLAAKLLLSDIFVIMLSVNVALEMHYTIVTTSGLLSQL